MLNILGKATQEKPIKLCCFSCSWMEGLLCIFKPIILMVVFVLPQDTLKPAFTVASLPGTTSTQPTNPTTSTTMQVSSGPSFPITNYLAPVSASSNTITSANGTVLKTTGASGGVMQLPGGFTFMSGTGGEASLILSRVSYTAVYLHTEIIMVLGSTLVKLRHYANITCMKRGLVCKHNF